MVPARNQEISPLTGIVGPTHSPTKSDIWYIMSPLRFPWTEVSLKWFSSEPEHISWKKKNIYKKTFSVLMMTFLEIRNLAHTMKCCFHGLIPVSMRNSFIFYSSLISDFSFEIPNFVVPSSATISSNLHFPGIHLLAHCSTFFFVVVVMKIRLCSWSSSMKKILISV